MRCGSLITVPWFVYLIIFNHFVVDWIISMKVLENSVRLSFCATNG